MRNRRTPSTTVITLRVGLLLTLTLLALIGTSCGPSGESAPPPAGDIEVLVAIDGPGSVRVDGYDCEGECAIEVDSGTELTFDAVPAIGNVLVAWGGVCEPLAPSCTRTFQAGDEVRATFAPHALRIDLTGDGVGTLEIEGPTVTAFCEGDCGIAFSESLDHSITIFPSGRTELRAWSGACDSADLPNYCVVRPTGATDVGKIWVHPPLAIDDAYDTSSNEVLQIPAAAGVLDNDADTADDVLTASVRTLPSSGTLDLAPDGGFRYEPNDGFVGSDSFRYVVQDAYGSEDVATVTIDVAQGPVVNSVAIDQNDPTLVVGDTTTLSATVTTTANAPTTVTWSSSNTTVATVNTSGTVTAVAPGTTTIKATSTFDTTKSDTIQVTVEEAVAVTSVTIDATTGEIEAKSAGSTRITAISAYDPAVSDAITLTVEEEEGSDDDDDDKDDRFVV